MPMKALALSVLSIAAVGWLDYVLLPALALFVGITLYALVRRQCAASGHSTRAREGT